MELERGEARARRLGNLHRPDRIYYEWRLDLQLAFGFSRPSRTRDVDYFLFFPFHVKQMDFVTQKLKRNHTKLHTPQTTPQRPVGDGGGISLTEKTPLIAQDLYTLLT
jgi:hypothetical protein